MSLKQYTRTTVRPKHLHLQHSNVKRRNTTVLNETGVNVFFSIIKEKKIRTYNRRKSTVFYEQHETILVPEPFKREKLKQRKLIFFIYNYHDVSD